MHDFPLPSFVARLPLTRRAVLMAVEAHAGQQRASDAAPFIVHPLEVASLLANRGQPDRVVAAGVLHDALEDSGLPAERIEAEFGAEVRALVEALTDDPSIPGYAERKARLRERVAAAGPEAAAVYAADKIAKVRELRAQAGRDPDRFGPATPDPSIRARIEHYEASVEMLERVLPGHPMVAQLRFEVEVYLTLPPKVTGR